VIQEWNFIWLKPGEKWETTLELPANISTSEPVKALLYRATEPGTIYRQLLLHRSQD
jgi:hypothetical protein